MNRNFDFMMNPAYVIGMALLAVSLLARNVLEVEGTLLNVCHFLSGGACGLLLIGLLYGSPKTRPLFDKFHAFKLRLIGRENTN